MGPRGLGDIGPSHCGVRIHHALPVPGRALGCLGGTPPSGRLAAESDASKDVDIAAPIVKFRREMYDLLRRRWLWLTLAQLGITGSQFLILFVALRGVEGWDQPGTNPIAAFGAFAVSQIMLMVPITPGGLGTMDAFDDPVVGEFGYRQGCGNRG